MREVWFVLNRKLRCLFLAFIFAFGLVSGSFAEITWTWQRFDQPNGTEYRQGYGSRESIPKVLLPKYQVPDAAGENEMRSILPVFTAKKAVGNADEINSYLYMPRHEEIQAFINDLANSPEGKQRMRIKPLGEYPKGMPLTLAVFSKPAVLEPDELKALGKPIVWMHGAVHANEQDAVNGLNYVLYKLASGQWDKYLEKTSVVLFLRVNADGAKLNIRGNPTRTDKIVYNKSNGAINSAIDLNRDSAWLEAPVLRVLHATWSDYYPQISAGLHQMASATNNFGSGAFLASKDISGNEVYHSSGRIQLWVDRNPDGSAIVSSDGRVKNAAPSSLTPSATYYYPYDITYAIGDHGNVPSKLRSYFYDKVVPSWENYMDSKKLKLWYYLEERTPGLVSNASGDKYYLPYYDDEGKQDGTGVIAGGTEGLWLDTGNMNATTTLKGAMGILVESRSPSHLPWTYPRRVYAQMVAMESLIKYAAENADEVMNVVAQARTDITNADKVYTMMKYADAPIVIKDVEYYNASGDIKKFDVPFYSARTVFPRNNDSVRLRPYAYILPRSEVNAVTAARIGFHGVKYYQLNSDTNIEVEVFEKVENAPFVHPVQNFRKAEEPNRANTNLLMSDDLIPWTPGFFVKVSKPAAKSVTIPKGSFVFYTSQPLGAYLAAVMEPDAERSFARITMSRKGSSSGQWSVPYRYMGQKQLDVKEVIQYYPLVDTAAIIDVRPVTGAELDSMASSDGLSSGERLLMAQNMDVISDAGGFNMQLQSSAKDFIVYAYDWNQSKFVKLDKASNGLANSYAVTSDNLGPSYNSELTKGMGTKTVLIAAQPSPAKSSNGCNSAYLPVSLILLCALYFKRRS